MGKKEDKRLGDDPFERFLPQIQDSRKKKDDDASADESVSATKSAGTNESNSKSKSAGKSASKSESKNTSTRTSKITSTSNDISDDTSKSANDGKSASKIDDAGTSETKSTTTSNGASGSAYESDGAAAIKIARKNKNSSYVKMTHYFRPDQLEAIETLHKESGRDKSELVRLAVDILIKQAKVE